MNSHLSLLAGTTQSAIQFFLFDNMMMEKNKREKMLNLLDAQFIEENKERESKNYIIWTFLLIDLY